MKLRKPRSRAFTFAEIVVVLIIMGIVAAVAIPKWSAALQTNRLTSAANRVISDLARAKAAAYTTSGNKTVTFTVGSSQYSIAGFTSLERASGTYAVNLADSPYYCQIQTVFGGTGTQTITFNGFGVPDKGGSIVLTNGGAQKTVVVDSYSGEARLQ